MLGLLRLIRRLPCAAPIVRIYYTVPFRHQLMAEMAKTVLADYAGFKQYVAALETSFTRLARKMGHVVVDKDKTVLPAPRPY